MRKSIPVFDKTKVPEKPEIIKLRVKNPVMGRAGQIIEVKYCFPDGTIARLERARVENISLDSFFFNDESLKTSTITAEIIPYGEL